MPPKKCVTVKGNTVDDAVKKALKKLCVEEEHVITEVISEGKKGFFGFGAKPAQVRVSLKEEAAVELELDSILGQLDLDTAASKNVSRDEAELDVETHLAYINEISAQEVKEEKASEVKDVKAIDVKNKETSTAKDVKANEVKDEENVVKVKEENEAQSEESKESKVQEPSQNMNQEITEESQQMAKVLEEKTDKVGMAEIKDGKLAIDSPVNAKKLATIKPGEQVNLTVNGEIIEEEIEVSDEDEVLVELIHVAPKSEFKFKLSRDELEAFMYLLNEPGVTYKLKDQPPSNEIQLLVEVDDIVEPTERNVAEVKDFLDQKNIVRGINEESIKLIIENPNSSDYFLVAQGQKPLDGKDAYIRYPFEEEEDLYEEGSIFNRDKLHSIRAGDIVAIKVPIKEGQDGWTVNDKVLAAKKPVDCDIHVTGGCELVDDESRVVASINGRPVTENMGNKVMVRVDPIFIAEEVNQATGDIIFSGEVEVKGDVTDGAVIQADGNVQVFGDISGATIIAGASVIVHKMIFGSKVTAGGKMALYTAMLPILKDINAQLKKITVKAQAKFNEKPLMTKEEFGLMLQNLIDSSFKTFPKTVLMLVDMSFPSHYSLSEEILKTVNGLHNYFIGLGPTRVTDISLITEIQNQVEEIITFIDEAENKNQYIKVRYVQNSTLISNNDVLIEGEGCYISTINAGRDVVISGSPGIARGVNIVAENNITLKNLGSDFDTSTYVKTGEQGKITAELISSNVVIQVGKFKERIDKFYKNFMVRLDSKGELYIEKLLADEQK